MKSNQTEKNGDCEGEREALLFFMDSSSLNQKLLGTGLYQGVRSTDACTHESGTCETRHHQSPSYVG